MKDVNAVAEKYGRTLDYGLRVHMIVRDTEAEAVANGREHDEVLVVALLLRGQPHGRLRHEPVSSTLAVVREDSIYLLDAHGGEPRPVVIEGLPSYTGSTYNGVTTSSWGAYGSSIVFDRN